MKRRDEFSPRTKNAVACRAGYICSFRDCKKLTVGPSDESSQSVASIGVAAHISAASPGGRRYLDSMSPIERSSIDNAIWLCSDHATLIDRDEQTYTIDVLRRMKSEHEANCESLLKRGSSHEGLSDDFFAIGPNVVCVGKFLGHENGTWNLHIEHFLIGDLHQLILFIEGFDKTYQGDRYVLVNELGDGRKLAGVPSFTRNGSGYNVRCPVLESFLRMPAQNISSDFAYSHEQGFLFENGDFKLVSGLDALPQKIRMNLSHQRGESPIHREFGSRFAEFYSEFFTTPWLDRLLKLEVIRLAAIPYHDEVLGCQYTPLQCINRVLDLEALADTPHDDWLPVRMDLDVEGVGRWQCETVVLIPDQIRILEIKKRFAKSWTKGSK